VKCSGVLQCSDGLSNKVSNIIRRLMDNMKCSGVLQCSDGLSNKVSNIIRKLTDNMKCSGVLQCSDGLSNKVSNIIRKLMDNMKLLLICILLLSHSFIFFRFYFSNIYVVLLLFDNVIYVFLLL
jgi:serine/threonine protein phosphatase PrpC